MALPDQSLPNPTLRQLQNRAKDLLTDRGMAQLKGLTNLWGLDLRIGQVTDAGVADLANALSDCKIHS